MDLQALGDILYALFEFSMLSTFGIFILCVSQTLDLFRKSQGPLHTTSHRWKVAVIIGAIAVLLCGCCVLVTNQQVNIAKEELELQYNKSCYDNEPNSSSIWFALEKKITDNLSLVIDEKDFTEEGHRRILTEIDGLPKFIKMLQDLENDVTDVVKNNSKQTNDLVALDNAMKDFFNLTISTTEQLSTVGDVQLLNKCSVDDTNLNTSFFSSTVDSLPILNEKLKNRASAISDKRKRLVNFSIWFDAILKRHLKELVTNVQKRFIWNATLKITSLQNQSENHILNSRTEIRKGLKHATDSEFKRWAGGLCLGCCVVTLAIILAILIYQVPKNTGNRSSSVQGRHVIKTRSSIMLICGFTLLWTALVVLVTKAPAGRICVANTDQMHTASDQFMNGTADSLIFDSKDEESMLNETDALLSLLGIHMKFHLQKEHQFPESNLIQSSVQNLNNYIMFYETTLRNATKCFDDLRLFISNKPSNAFMVKKLDDLVLHIFDLKIKLNMSTKILKKFKKENYLLTSNFLVINAKSKEMMDKEKLMEMVLRAFKTFKNESETTWHRALSECVTNVTETDSKLTARSVCDIANRLFCINLLTKCQWWIIISVTTAAASAIVFLLKELWVSPQE
ncbi:uncharacterized protein LOC131944590 [Physella acuta]|uniref:uncharacterized protein LOC131944590 n=1 Tax=Physella acuta TaxID=109671 RepID=UPI0027DC1B38|nr:uncharacterized protein LOC131944590 [Physella acuta]